MVGIVSRANLVQALASLARETADTLPSDATLRELVLAEIDKHTISSSGVSSHYRLGIGRNDISDLASVRTDMLGRQAALAEKELQPAGPASLRSSFGATQKIPFRRDTDEFARGSTTGRPLILFNIMSCAASNTEESSFTDTTF